MKIQNVKTKVASTSLVLLMSLASSIRSHAAEPKTPWFADSTLPTEVQAAHDSFLRGDFERLSADLKRALMAYPEDASIRRNVLDLYDKAYELKGDAALKPDWTAPAGVPWIGVTSKKKYNVNSHAIQHRVQMSLDYDKTKKFEQLRIIRYPKDVLIDTKAGIGEFTQEPDGTALMNVWAAQDYQQNPNEEGLYLFELKFKGEPMTAGWFVLSKMNAAESPEILEPLQNAVLTTGTPTFRWKNFVSSNYRGFERRRVSAHVTQRAPNVMDNIWASYNLEPTTEVTVGAPGLAQNGVPALPRGDYVLQILYRESHRFGDLSVARDSGTITPFSVK